MIVVGGGFAGAALVSVLARAGAKVLVLERQTRFKDRVRGEILYPWGVAAGRLLGVVDPLTSTVARPLARWTTNIQPLPVTTRDVRATSLAQEPALTFHHPEAQEVLLAAAEDAGATVVRDATVVAIQPGDRPTVLSREGRSRKSVTRACRMVVGADGRDSVARRDAGLIERRALQNLRLVGASLQGTGAPEDAGGIGMLPAEGLIGVAFPAGEGRHRVYAGYTAVNGELNLSGPAALPRFLELAARAGLPRAWLGGAQLGGPLAEFDSSESWVDLPYVPGVALVGDAASISTPSFGCGLSLAWRDTSLLAGLLAETDDWDAAGRDYASRHAVYHGAIRRHTSWLTDIFLTPGPEADTRREVALPLFAADPSRAPDVMGLGPEGPSDEAARRRFYGEE